MKKYLPVLKNYPKKYIYEPWKAPAKDQKAWKCVIGEDYPMPIVDHQEASKKAKENLKAFFAAQKN